MSEQMPVKEPKASPMELGAYVELDTRSRDYGRLKDKELAQDLANQINAVADHSTSDNPYMTPQEFIDNEAMIGRLDSHAMAGIARKIIEASGVELADIDKHNLAVHYSHNLYDIDLDDAERLNEQDPLRRPENRQQLDLKLALSEASYDYWAMAKQLPRQNNKLK